MYGHDSRENEFTALDGELYLTDLTGGGICQLVPPL